MALMTQMTQATPLFSRANSSAMPVEPQQNDETKPSETGGVVRPLAVGPIGTLGTGRDTGRDANRDAP
jgi:hypothetical protein